VADTFIRHRPSKAATLGRYAGVVARSIPLLSRLRVGEGSMTGRSETSSSPDIAALTDMLSVEPPPNTGGNALVVSGRTPSFPHSVPHSVDYTPLTQPFFPTVTSQCSPSYLKPLGRLHSGHSSRTNLTGSPLSRNRISIRRRVLQCSHRRWRRSQYNSSYIGVLFLGRADMGSPPLRFAYTVWCVGGLISSSPPASHPQLHASADGHFL